MCQLDYYVVMGIAPLSECCLSNQFGVRLLVSNEWHRLLSRSYGYVVNLSGSAAGTCSF